MAATTSPDQVASEVVRRGFAVVPRVMSPEEVDAARVDLTRAIDEDLEAWNGRDYPDAWMVHNLMLRGRPFEQLLDNERLHEHLSLLLGDTCILYAYTSSSMPAGGANFSARVHVDSPRLIPGYITNVGVMIALDDYTDENGATWYLPESQERADAPSLEAFLEDAERVYPRAGDMVIFNARTWHMGGSNQTNDARHAVTMNVCRSYMRQRFDYPRLVPSEIVERVGPVARRFMGFDVRMPTSLDEYYLPEGERLYKAGQG